MPSAIESAATGFGVATITLGALAAAAGVFAWWFSDRVSRNKDAELKKFQSESQVAIAAANARADSAQATAESFKRDIATANERAASAQEQAAKFNVIAEQERLARVQLEARLAPRHLSVDQQQSIGKGLAQFSERSVDVYLLGPTGESARFTESVIAALGVSGWTPRQWTVSGNASATGVLVCTKVGSDADTIAAAALLIELLQRAGIDAGAWEQFDGPLPVSGMVSGPSVDPKGIAPVRVIIGNKP